jgi:Predicted deacylase
MIIANKSVSRGSKEVVKANVARLTSGNDLKIIAHVIAGSNDGKTLGLIGGIHGDETHCFEFFNKLIQNINPKDLNGNLIIIPVANPLAFENLSRNTPTDNLDLNRNFPGNKDGWLTEKIAYVISEEFVKKMDYLIDFHTSPPFLVVEYTIISKNSKNKEEFINIAKSFGFKFIYNTYGYKGALTTFATEIGITSIATESGPINEDNEAYSNTMIKKIKNVLALLNLINSKPNIEGDFLIFEENAYGNMRAPAGGIFIPGDPEIYIGKEKDENSILFKIYDPYTFDLIKEVKPIFKRSAVFLYRKRSVVKPGDYCYMICDLNKSNKV